MSTVQELHALKLQEVMLASVCTNKRPSSFKEETKKATTNLQRCQITQKGDV
jgi:hypothetical protein